MRPVPGGNDLKRDRVLVASFALWLGVWIFLSWAAIQDDALIHLRYADHLRQFHAVTYDGVHPNFGTSSLLFVTVLAAATTLWSSPELPRLLSSIFHVLLVFGLAWMLLTRIPAGARLPRWLSLILLALLVVPSSIRWLDDGMETGMALCATASVASLAFRESRRQRSGSATYAGLLLLGAVLVFLRSELAVLAGLASAAIVAGRLQRLRERSVRAALNIVVKASHFVVGALIACAAIVRLMGVLLPDTALAKAEGIHAWKNVLIATAVVLTSSFGIGAGLLLFSLLTLALLVRRRRLDAAAVIVNLTFPLVLGLSMLRGQAVQGVRYILWTLLFPSVWNILAIAADQVVEGASARVSMRLVYGFALLLLLELPIESRVMYGVLTHRAATMREFEGQHLGRLAGLHGVSMDIGYIGYFSQAQICDMSGLVNGRAVARMSPRERIQRCANEHPQFAFGNVDQLHTLAGYMDLTGWRVCNGYDFVNVRTPDRHYLVSPAAMASAVCGGARADGGMTQGMNPGIETVLPGSS